MQINSRYFVFALFLSIVGRVLAYQGVLPPGARFEIVSVKVLSPREAADRSPDSPGPNDVAVRLRLSCANSGFYFYSWRDGVTPVGYRVKFEDGKLQWLNKMPGHSDQHSSPGIDKLNAFVPGVWRLMSGHDHPAIEWDELDSTSLKGEKHAFTVFVKIDEKDKPVEVFSDFYVVPGSPATAN
jgi:hypothetical protein